MIPTNVPMPQTPDSQAPLFTVRNLSVTRGDVRILANINWTMHHGEHWVILGANGSGKTSLLKALTGYMTPTRGEITVLGEEFGESDWRELRKHVGVVSASISHLVHDEDTGLEIVAGGKNAMIGYWGRITRADAGRARRLLGLLRVACASDRTWEVLSQGERQRVLIARALMADPVILILDEPCSGLDPVARERFLRDLGRLARGKNAPGLLFVTHHIEEILPEFTHLLALKKGRTAYSGPKSGGLNSRVLAGVFQAPLSVRRTGGRYQLKP
ncbi:MAG TPA: ATP-binding cassette domain-containing protein [Terrimicrobiaceae bacterium]|nr:ATP-binding cassette domain-containing protein [Terrimicrobiaceae bacterium]